MRHREATLGHHLHQVSQTELEPKIPAHAQDDDFAVEVATLKQLRYGLQLAYRRPQPVQHANVADRTPPFAPEPLPTVPAATDTRRKDWGKSAGRRFPGKRVPTNCSPLYGRQEVTPIAADLARSFLE
jgi:hypothetical protein